MHYKLNRTVMALVAGFLLTLPAYGQATLVGGDAP